jgi:hypothetical protein
MATSTHPPTVLSPAPRFGLAWVTWRQHRAALIGACAVLGADLAYMLFTGLRMRSALASLGLNSCHAAARCGQLVTLFNSEYDVWRNNGLIVMQVLPMFVGVFVGGPLLARELETGTFRFAWTQGTGRTRWVIAKLALVAAVIAAAAAVVSVTCGWWLDPFVSRGWSRLSPNVFPLTGLAFPAWTLLAFALGVFVGMLIRRTVPAMGTALAVWAVLAIGTANYLRWRYQMPLTTRPGVTGGAGEVPGSWGKPSWVGPGGRPVSESAIRGLAGRLTGAQAPTAHLARLGYREVLSYQPAGRYWQFQFIEAGWLLALVVLLLAATVWLVRRRAT